MPRIGALSEPRGGQRAELAKVPGAWRLAAPLDLTDSALPGSCWESPGQPSSLRNKAPILTTSEKIRPFSSRDRLSSLQVRYTLTLHTTSGPP